MTRNRSTVFRKLSWITHFVKTHWTIHVTSVNSIVHKLYFNKADFKKEREGKGGQGRAREGREKERDREMERERERQRKKKRKRKLVCHTKGRDFIWKAQGVHGKWPKQGGWQDEICALWPQQGGSGNWIFMPSPEAVRRRHGGPCGSYDT